VRLQRYTATWVVETDQPAGLASIPPGQVGRNIEWLLGRMLERDGVWDVRVGAVSCTSQPEPAAPAAPVPADGLAPHLDPGAAPGPPAARPGGRLDPDWRPS
jgi:hypothetical protein